MKWFRFIGNPDDYNGIDDIANNTLVEKCGIYPENYYQFYDINLATFDPDDWEEVSEPEFNQINLVKLVTNK